VNAAPAAPTHPPTCTTNLRPYDRSGRKAYTGCWAGLAAGGGRGVAAASPAAHETAAGARLRLGCWRRSKPGRPGRPGGKHHATHSSVRGTSTSRRGRRGVMARLHFERPRTGNAGTAVLARPMCRLTCYATLAPKHAFPSCDFYVHGISNGGDTAHASPTWHIRHGTMCSLAPRQAHRTAPVHEPVLPGGWLLRRMLSQPLGILMAV
jgi:hypothetical protein